MLKNLVAHRDRNGATALMFSLILGFIIFLNIVCKIPNSHQFYEDLKYKGYHSFTWGRMVLPINRFDEALKIFDQKYNEIEELGLVTTVPFNKNNDIYW